MKTNIFLGLMLSLLTFGEGLRAQGSPNQTSAAPYLRANWGKIPLKETGFVATDLIYQDMYLSSDEALQLWRSGQVSDLSELEPSLGVEIEGKFFPSQIYSGELRKEKKSPVLLGSEPVVSDLTFLAYNERIYDQIKIRVMDSEGRRFLLYLGPRARNQLMANQLLYKLGYNSTRSRYLKTAKIKFPSVGEKQSFLMSLNPDGMDELLKAENYQYSDAAKKKMRNLLSGIEEYMPEGIFDGGDSIELRNVVLVESNAKHYNLSFPVNSGPMSNEVLGRRKLNSLSIPICLTDLPSSLNLFSRSLGNIVDESLVMGCLFAPYFATPKADAVWIAKRILSLSENDWQDITDSFEAPVCPSKLLLEKLIARRNSLISIFDLNEYAEFPLGSPINCGKEEVVNGVQIQRSYPNDGHAYTHDRYEGPLIGEEAWGFAKSIATSLILRDLLGRLNDRIPEKSAEEGVYKHNIDLAARQFVEYITTGKISKVPFGSYPVEFSKYSLLYSRDIVMGNYMGASNLVQLVDSFGVAIQYGKFFGFDGLKAYERLFGITNLGMQLSFTHIQPIKIDKPKIIGQDNVSSKVKGPIEEAAKKQRSKLLDVFLYPFQLVSLEGESSAPAFNSLRDALSFELKAFKNFLMETKSPLAGAFDTLLENSNKDNFLSGETERSVGAFFDELQKLWEVDLEGEPCEGDCVSLSSRFVAFYEKALEAYNQGKPQDQQKRRQAVNPKMLGYAFLEDIAGFYRNQEKHLEEGIAKKVDGFLKELPVGDSLIVHLGLDAGARLSPSHVLSTSSNWFVDASYEKKLALRVHIQRASATEVRVYRSRINEDLWGFLSGIQFYFRVFSTGYDYSLAEVNSRMHSLSFKKVEGESGGKDLYQNDPHILDKLEALRELILTGSLGSVKKYSQALKVDHSVENEKSNLNFLFFKVEAYDSMDVMDIENTPTEEDFKIFRYGKGSRAGKDYQNFVTDWLEAVLRDRGKDVSLKIAGNSDPGMSILGTSRSKQAVYEAMATDDNSPLENQCLTIKGQWNQFYASKDEVDKEIESLKERYGVSLIDLSRENQIRNFQLMNFILVIDVYQKAIERVSKMTEQELTQIVDEGLLYPQISKHPLEPPVGFSRLKDKRLYDQKWKDRVLRQSFFNKLQKIKRSGTHEEKVRSLLDFVLLAEKRLRFSSLKTLLGGQENFHMSWLILGYRSGDENATPILERSSLGPAPSRSACPTSVISRKTGYSENEINLQWRYQEY